VDEPTRLLDDPDADDLLRSDLRALRDAERPIDVPTTSARLSAALASATPTMTPASTFPLRLTIVVAGVMLASLGLWWLRGSSDSAEPARPRETDVAPARRPTVRETMPGPRVPTVPPAPVETTGDAPAREPERSPAAAPAAPAAHARMERETELMNRERSEAQEGDPASALALAQRGDREFPSGYFVDEREAFAIVALDRMGRRAEAVERGQRFLAAHAHAPHATMVRRIVERP